MDAEQIIRQQQRLENADGNFRNLWQDTANYQFPRENNIVEYSTPGEVKFDRLYDVTAVIEAENMTSGLLTSLIPAGQKFFSLTTSDATLKEVDPVKSYLAHATEILHEELYTSNFLLQIKETLHSLVVFGTGCIFEDWRGGLNFMDWDVSRYQLIENFRGVVDTTILKFPKTALQAYQKWGKDAGKSIVEIFEGPSPDDKKHGEIFWFIHIVRPRQWRNPRMEDSLNMEWESGYISCKDKIVIDEGGYPEFPYMVPRWAKTTGEVHGRGIGTMILPQVKMLNANKRDFNQVGNKYANPHREVLSTFQGTYKTYPGARNDVMDLPSSHVDQRQFGNFPITKETLEMARAVVKEAYYHDAFAPLTGLTGDRRNELEIQQRIQEAFRRIGSLRRLENELFTPLIERGYMLLVRNGVIPNPPEELQGQNLKIMYKGPLSLAQQDSEVRASKQWVGDILEMENSPSFAGAADNVNVDKMVRRLGRVYGTNEDDIATEEQRDAKREQRRIDKEKQEALEAAQVAAGAYGQTTKAPESGSAAEQMGALG